MKNREFLMTLNDEHLESAIYHLGHDHFDLAKEIKDPTEALTNWLSAKYDPNDSLWQRVNDENDDEWWAAQGL